MGWSSSKCGWQYPRVAAALALAGARRGRYVIQALEDGLKRADADPSVKAIVICGENGKFSAGKTFSFKHMLRTREKTVSPSRWELFHPVTLLGKHHKS
uniref:Uncharacterized protein n=1 Tax=Dromaius novaehollandiae TaxID=8790 RepID=A0A8C4JS22_DRONO